MSNDKIPEKVALYYEGGPRIPMQFTEVELWQVEDLIRDPAWVFEQKFDGTRGLCVISPTGVWWPGRDGFGSLRHTAATQHFASLNPILEKLLDESVLYGEIVLDGEIMIATGEYHVWDLVYMLENGATLVDPANSNLNVRRRILESLFERLPQNGPIKLVKQARGPVEKRNLWEAVRQGGGEGIMAKRLDGNYDVGQRVDHTLKLKFVKTADVVVLEVNRPDPKHGNFIIGAFNDKGVMTCIGACSAIGKDPETKVYDVIEIAYLYWTGDCVYQPRMLKIRKDKSPKECLLSQFPEYNRSAF